MKICVVGYSLGGLVARYAIGLLYSRGWFDKIEPVVSLAHPSSSISHTRQNFTTFACPHLGVRTPPIGFFHQLWNTLGSRTLSMSGRQLFTIDSFRDTGRPLLSLLADADSIFIRALARFKHRCLYTNIINDRTAPYYTTSISRVDPYTRLSEIQVNYVEGYDDIIVDASDPVSAKEEEELPSSFKRMVEKGQVLLRTAPTMLGLTLFIPIGLVAFLLNSVVQTVRSSQRIKLHEAGKAGVGIGSYRIPLMVENVQSAMEGVLEDFSRGNEQGYEALPTSDGHSNGTASTYAKKADGGAKTPLEFPTLALSDEQFAMIESLDQVGFAKHPVHIHKGRHSHAAMIVRIAADRYSEGKTVMRHWLDCEFEV